jgi:hypothetical protein
LRRLLISMSVAALLLVLILPAQEKLNSLIVMFTGGTFGVREPSGWTGDTTNAGEVSANVIFFPKSEGWPKTRAFIYVQVSDQKGEDLPADLASDKANYKKRYPKIVFKDISVAHSKYSTIASGFFLPGEFTEYVVYISPGKTKRVKFAAILNVTGREATDQELAALREVVSSLVLLAP